MNTFGIIVSLILIAGIAVFGVVSVKEMNEIIRKRKKEEE